MTLQRLEASLLCSCRQKLDEGRLGEGTRATLVLISKEVGVLGRVVYLALVFKRDEGVCGPRVRALINVFTLKGGCLGVRQMKDGDLEAVGVPVNA